MELTDLVKKQTTMTYGFIAVIVVLVLVFGGLMLHTVQKYGETVGNTKALVQEFNQREDERGKQLKEAYEKIAYLSSQQKVVEHRIEIRDKQTTARVEQVTAPDRSVEQVMDDSKTYLRTSPIYLSDQKLFGFTKPDVQGFVKNKIERDAFELNYKDKSQSLTFEQQKNELLNQQLTTANVNLADAKGTVKQLRDNAIKTKKQKIGDALWKGVIGLAGFGLGRATQ